MQRQGHLPCFLKSGINRTIPLNCQWVASIPQKFHQDPSVMTITKRLRRQRHLRAVFRRVGVRAGPISLAEAPQLSTLYTYNALLQFNRGPSAIHIYNTAQVRTKALHTNTCNTFLHSTEPQLSAEAPQLSTLYTYNTSLGPNSTEAPQLSIFTTLHSYCWTEQQCSACLHPFALDGWMESGSLTRSLLNIKSNSKGRSKYL